MKFNIGNFNKIRSDLYNKAKSYGLLKRTPWNKFIGDTIVRTKRAIKKWENTHIVQEEPFKVIAEPIYEIEEEPFKVIVDPIEIAQDMLRDNRIFKSNVFIQKILPSINDTFGELDIDCQYLNLNFDEQVKKSSNILNDIPFKAYKCLIGYYVISEQDKELYQEGTKNYFDLTNEENIFKNKKYTIITKRVSNLTGEYVPAINFTSIDVIWVILDYKILVGDAGATFEKHIKQLKAFLPNQNSEYHKLTACSTTKSKLCIWESYYYLYIEEFKFIKNEKTNKKTIINKIKESLNNETEEIIKYVKNGELVNFLSAKSNENDETYYVQFFKPIGESQGFKIHKDEITEIKNKDDFNNKKVFLYDNNHVAPRRNIHYSSDFKFDPKTKKLVKDKKIEKFILKPSQKKKEMKIDKILAYDFEVYTENTITKPFCVCLSNGMKFYGNNTVKEFCDYIDSIKTETDLSKTKANKAIPQIFIYGFNNSRFDNTFIFEELKKRNSITKYIILENDIKYIRYFNVNFYDLSLYYAGSLDSVAKSFKLDINKGVYPYTFPNKDNLNYIGEVPNVKYWKSEKDRNEYIQKNGNVFNLKEYTIKYCLLDTELTEQIALKHLSQCVGTIDIKQKDGSMQQKTYDVRKCPTGAKIALSMYNQVFQNDILVESPEKIQLKERNAYKGGRTEVFKKSSIYTNDQGENISKYLYYFDINSSYPNAMQYVMPYQFKVCLELPSSEIIKNENDLVDHYLYLAKSTYVGNDDYVIPNLLVRSSKNDIIALKETDYSYHWGIELKEAIKNNFKIEITEINQYEGIEIFKEFANYFYNERLKVKESNPAKANFFKLVMNSLYGKWGQNMKENIAICNSPYEVNTIIQNPKNKITNFDIIGDLIKLNYIREDDDKKCIGSLVRFASYITAIARTNLAIMMRDVGHENIYYCDTDSVFTSKYPSSKLLDNNTLGKWKLENACNWTVFMAPKTYKYKSLVPKENQYCENPEYDCYTKEEHWVVPECIKNKVECKGKGVPNNLLKPEHYDMKSHVIDLDCMFYRKINEVRICTDISRTLQPVYNKRIWEDNNSKPYNNYNEWFNEKYNK